jgi:hypothetical protein
MHSHALGRVLPRALILGLLLALVTIFGATALSNSHTPSKPIAFVDCNALNCGDGG